MHVAGIICAILGCLLSATARAAPPSLEAFGRLPAIENVTLSPNGQLLAWLDNAGGKHRSALVVHDLAAHTDKTVIPLDSGRLRTIRWVDDSTLLLDLSETQRVWSKTTAEIYGIVAVDVANARSARVLPQGSDNYPVGAKVLALRTATPGKVMMSLWDWLRSVEGIGPVFGPGGESGWVNAAFLVDTRTGLPTSIERGSKFTDDWVVDATGRPVARSDWQPSLAQYSVRSRAGEGWRQIHKLGGERMQLVGLSQDTQAVLALGANGKDYVKLWSMPLDGSHHRVLVEDAQQDVTSIVRDALTGVPIAVEIGTASAQMRWLDVNAENIYRRLRHTFPQGRVEIVGRSEDYARVVARVESPTHAPVYHLIDFRTHSATIIGEAYPELMNAKLGEVRALRYRARDGAEIPAYVTLPPGAEERNLPLVVLPHDGPEARDEMRFAWLAQFLASRGYAVLQPQFRGSTGFGEVHRRAGRQQWGALMQEDVADGVRWMVETGLADPRRVCIVGLGYGGYVALAGAAFTPKLYACAVGINGIFDIPRYLFWKENLHGDQSNAYHYLLDRIGSKMDPRLAQRSPVRAVASIVAPVLLVHSVHDPLVQMAQSEAMHKALIMRIPTGDSRLVQLDGDDHALSRSADRVRLLGELEYFLNRHLGCQSDSGEK